MENLDFGEPRQNPFEYPMPLVEKYQPLTCLIFGTKRFETVYITAPSCETGLGVTRGL